LLIGAFPKQLQDKYSEQMQEHPLRAEIIATKLANKLGNDMGFNFVNRMQEETGAPVHEIANCYTMASEVFEMEEIWQGIEKLDNKIQTIVQTEMLFQLRRNVRRATRWFLRHRNKALDIQQTIDFYRPTFESMAENIHKFMDAEEFEGLKRVESDLVNAGVPKKISARISQLSTLFSVMDIAEIANTDGRSIEFVAQMYFGLGQRLSLHWFLDQITKQPVSNHWQALARASFREELDWQQRSTTMVALKVEPKGDNIDAILDKWFEQNSQPLERWEHILAEFRTSQTHEFAKFSVALRELMLLSMNSDPVQ